MVLITDKRFGKVTLSLRSRPTNGGKKSRLFCLMEKTLSLFIDESGDFVFKKGSSGFYFLTFVFSLLIFVNTFIWEKKNCDRSPLKLERIMDKTIDASMMPPRSSSSSQLLLRQKYERV